MRLAPTDLTPTVVVAADYAGNAEQAPVAAVREALEAAGVLVETTGKKRDRVYAYQAYLDRLRSGTGLGDEG